MASKCSRMDPDPTSSAFSVSHIAEAAMQSWQTLFHDALKSLEESDTEYPSVGQRFRNLQEENLRQREVIVGLQKQVKSMNAVQSEYILTLKDLNIIKNHLTSELELKQAEHEQMCEQFIRKKTLAAIFKSLSAALERKNILLLHEKDTLLEEVARLKRLSLRCTSLDQQHWTKQQNVKQLQSVAMIKSPEELTEAKQQQAKRIVSLSEPFPEHVSGGTRPEETRDLKHQLQTLSARLSAAEAQVAFLKSLTSEVEKENVFLSSQVQLLNTEKQILPGRVSENMSSETLRAEWESLKTVVKEYKAENRQRSTEMWEMKEKFQAASKADEAAANGAQPQSQVRGFHDQSEKAQFNLENQAEMEMLKHTNNSLSALLKRDELNERHFNKLMDQEDCAEGNNRITCERINQELKLQLLQKARLQQLLVTAQRREAEIAKLQSLHSQAEQQNEILSNQVAFLNHETLKQSEQILKLSADLQSKCRAVVEREENLSTVTQQKESLKDELETLKRSVELIVELMPKCCPTPVPCHGLIGGLDCKPIFHYLNNEQWRLTEEENKMNLENLGLENFGNSCYLNATVQSLMTLEPFMKNICSQEPIWGRSRDAALLRHLHIILNARHAPVKNNKVVFLCSIKALVATKEPQFQDGDQKDAHEFFTVLMEQIVSLAPTLQKVASQLGTAYVCPVQENMVFQMEQIRTCCACGAESRKREVFTHLPLIMRPDASTDDLLQDSLQETSLEVTCPCGSERSSLRPAFASLPRVLVLQLVRFRYTWRVEKVTGRVLLDRDVALSSGPDEARFSLTGIISHLGNNAHFGHYIFDGRHPTDPQQSADKWLTYSDTVVREASRAEVCAARESSAYILFYQRVAP